LRLSKPALGVVCGLVFGALSAASMIPLEFPDKTAALAGAFTNRLAIGIVIGSVSPRWPGWATGLAFGLLLSLPDAIITKGYVPILAIGAIGGAIIGALIHRAPEIRP
jgi:hypothetical protein